MRQFRDQQRQPEAVFVANDHASNLDELTGAYAGPAPVKRQLVRCQRIDGPRNPRPPAPWHPSVTLQGCTRVPVATDPLSHARGRSGNTLTPLHD